MIIQSLELSDFRNYESLKLQFGEGINVISGANGQGKTNILEAIVLCGTSHSHRGSKDREMIRFGCEEAHIRAQVQKKRQEVQIDLHLRRQGTKGIAVNRRPLQRAAQLIGMCSVVVFSPEDLRIIKSGPAERRNFINQTLCQTDQIYFHDLIQYHKALRQRNQLLKDIPENPSLEETLDLWDLQLISYGKKIIRRRESFLQELNRTIIPIHTSLTGDREKIFISYQKNTAEETYEANFRKNRQRDLRFQMTHVGPHRDDLQFLVNEIDMRDYGSQGQQKTCALSLKLSSIEMIRQAAAEKPVLLLDDVFSELDAQRQQDLLQYISGLQTIITCTGADVLLRENIRIDQSFEVVGGSVVQAKQEA